MEVNSIPASIRDEELELNICKALSLTGHEVKADDLQTCNRLKKKERKTRVFVDRKNLWHEF